LSRFSCAIFETNAKETHTGGAVRCAFPTLKWKIKEWLASKLAS
jgi:hypothetical protein